jgi:Tfp pilus assembly protein PilF
MIRTVLPYLAVSIVYFALRQHALHHFSVVLTPLAVRTILLTWPSVLWFYVRGLVWPFDRGLFPDLPYVSTPAFWNFWVYILAIAACIGVLSGWSRGRQETRFLLVAMGLPILPVLNFAAFSEGELAHDRYLYVPSAFFALLAARVIVDYLKLPAVQAAVMAAVAAIFGYLTVRESRPYANGIDLFSRGLAMSPNNNIAATNLAAALFQENRPAEAIPLLESVQRRRADLPGVVYLIGLCYFRMNLFPEAETYLRRAIQIVPRDPRPRLIIGLIQFSRRQLSEAESSMREAIRLQPTGHYWFYHFHLGRVLKAKGDRQAALAQFEEELVHNPGLPEAKAEIQKLQAAVSQ